MRKFVAIAVIATAGVIVLAVSSVGGALALENQDSFCAACHTQPETTFFQRSLQKNSPDLAAYHATQSTHCIDCHSGSGTFGRAKGLQQGAHDLTAYLSGAYHKPAITTNPLDDDSCTKCHAKVLAQDSSRTSRAMNGHYHYYLLKWQQADADAARCATCHSAHVPNLASLKFMRQGKVGQICEKCHDALSGQVK